MMSQAPLLDVDVQVSFIFVNMTQINISRITMGKSFSLDSAVPCRS